MANKKKSTSALKKTAIKATEKPKTVPETVAEETPKQSTRQQRFQAIIRRIGRFMAHSSVPEILLVATLCSSRYITNSDFSYPSEIILNIVLLGIVVTVLFYIYKLIIRSWLGAHIAALLLTYGLYNFTSAYSSLRHFAHKLIPNSATSFTQALLLVLFLGLIFGVIGYIVNRIATSKRFVSVPVFKFMLFVVCFIFVAQMGKVGMRLWEIRKDLTYTQPVSSLQKTTNNVSTTKPNVYYLLFDRYANDTTLKNIYNYDNSLLLNGLKQQGFVVRDDAYANYPFTMQSVSSTLAADYHNKIGKEFKNDAKGFQTGFAYRTVLDNSPVTQAFKANGYTYNQVSSWWDFTRHNPSADNNPSKSFRLRVFGKNFWLTDLQRDIVNKSVLSPLLLKGVTVGKTTLIQYQLDRNPTQNFYAEMSALKAIANASSNQTKPQFTFAHILSPHDPYIFDAEGNKPTYDGNRTDNGIDETKKYTNQVTFLNTQISDLITTIRTKDPSAAIILQADEGPYPKQFRGTLTANSYYDPINLPLEQQRQKFGVLAAYYMPDTDTEAVKSGITASANTFRFVLNRYLGYNLQQLPDCQFTVGDKFNLYTYNLVSGKLKGTTEPAECNQYK